MNIADDVERAVCITVPGRWPEGFRSVHAQFAARGIEVTPLINGRAEELPPDVPHLVNSGEPPATFRGAAGSWWARRAFRHIVEQAMADGVERLLIAEDDALFVREADEILEGAEVPLDWAMIYLGAMHHWGETADVGPGVVRTFGARAIHAVIYRRSCFEALLDLPGEAPLDDEIAEKLHPQLPCYALWSAAVIQEAGISTITGQHSALPEFFASRGRADHNDL